MRAKKTIGIILSIIFSIALIITIFFTTMDIVVYGNMPDSFVEECVKYDVLDDVGVSEEELAVVSEEMFEYLRGNKKLLSDITATINGEPDTAFFNEKECLHMADCQKLFLAGYDLWKWSGIVAGALLIIIILMFIKQIGGALHCLAVGMLSAAGVMTLIIGLLTIVVSQNFLRYFTLFHQIFFDNDLWILDPSKDRLLMIMPEGYFVDCVIQIGVIFGVCIVVLLALAIVRLIWESHNETRSTDNN